MSKLQQALSKVSSPKVSLSEIQGQQYSAQNVQVSPTNSIELPSLEPLVNAAGEYVKKRERQAVEINNQRLFENMTPEQLKAARQSGALPFADDLYANRAMIRQLGRNEALNVDAEIQNRLKNMDFANAEEMNKTRSEMMKKAQLESAEAYGIDPNSTYWNEGMRDNMVERNLALMTAQTQATDTQLRNKSKIIVNGGIDSLLRVPVPNRAAAIMKHIEQNEADGLIRNPFEKQAAIEYAMSQIVGTDAGAQDIQQMANEKVNIFGAETTIGEFLGHDKIMNLTSQAERSAYDRNWKLKEDWMKRYSDIKYADVSTPEGFQKAQQQFQQLMADTMATQPSNVTSAEKESLMRLHLELNLKNAQAADANKKKLISQGQSDERYRSIRERALQRFSGMGVPLDLNSFPETEATGKYEDNDYALFYKRYSAEIDSDQSLTPEQRTFKKMKLGMLFKGVDKGGFGTHYKAEMAAIDGELEAVNYAAQAGQDELPPTPNLNMYQDMYKQDPKLFMATFGEDSKIATEIGMTASLGIDLRTYLKGKAINDKLNVDRATQMQRSQEWQAQMVKRGAGNIFTALSAEQKETYMDLYQGMSGIAPNKAMQVIMDNVNANFMDLSKDIKYNGVVERSQLMIDPADPESATRGADVLQQYIDNNPKFTTLKPNAIYSQGDNIVIFNTQGVDFVPASKIQDLAREYGYLK